MRPLSIGDKISARPCVVTVTETRAGTAYGLCDHCQVHHVIDKAMFDAGRGPWKREACCRFAGLRGDYRCEGECRNPNEPMDYDEWVSKTSTIRRWVNHQTVATNALISELEFWLEEMREDG